MPHTHRSSRADSHSQHVSKLEAMTRNAEARKSELSQNAAVVSQAMSHPSSATDATPVFLKEIEQQEYQKVISRR